MGQIPAPENDPSGTKPFPPHSLAAAAAAYLSPLISVEAHREHGYPSLLLRPLLTKRAAGHACVKVPALNPAGTGSHTIALNATLRKGT